MKLTALIVISFLCVHVPGAVGEDCPGCTFYIVGFTPSSSSVIQQGRNTLTLTKLSHQFLKSLFFTMVETGSEACSTYPTEACSENGECIPGPEGEIYYNCQCKEGNFEEIRQKGKYFCEDVNECAKPELNECDVNAVCINFAGYYECDCNAGFSGDGWSCVDENECLTDEICGENEACENLNGSFACLCIAGFNKTDGENCVDVNECEHGIGHCDMGADVICDNTEGSYICRCEDGFQLIGTICKEHDPCSEPDACGKNEQCKSVDGSLSCSCLPGFLSRDESGCDDIDECFINEDNCDRVNGVCLNTDGEFTCKCNSGFTGDGITCTGNTITALPLETTTTAISLINWLEEVALARRYAWLHGDSLRRIQNWFRMRQYVRATCGRYRWVGKSRCG